MADLPVLPDINKEFKQQLQRMRATTPVRQQPQASLSFSPTPDSQADNTALYLSHAKPGPYKTQLTDKEEGFFQQWVKENAVPWRDVENTDYDMRGYWKALVSGDKRAKQSENKHYPDIWKTPYHKSFSRESMYALPTAPEWKGDKLVGSNGKVLVDESVPPKTEEPAPESPQAYVEKYAPIYGVDPKLIHAMMGRESGGNQKAVSPKGALGLMQLMPDTARDLGVDPNDPEDNVRGGVKYMSELLAHFNGDTRLALAAYQAGQGAVDKAKGIPNTTDGLTRTADYVDQIMARYERLSASQSPLAMSPTPAAEQKKPEVKPEKKYAFTELPSDPVTYLHQSHSGAQWRETYDRSEAKNELAKMRAMGQKEYLGGQELKFTPPPEDETIYESGFHPFKMMGWLIDTWHQGAVDASEIFFQTAEDEDNQYHKFLKEKANDPNVPKRERDEYAYEMRQFELGTAEKERKGGYEDVNLPWYERRGVLVGSRATFQTLADWYNPMMMGLRIFHVVGETASVMTGRSGMIARRAFYIANAAVGGKFTFDQTKSAMDKFGKGDSVGGWSELGGAGATAFMTALGLAAARPKAHPIEVQQETLKRLEALHKTLREQPEFRRIGDLIRDGKVQPLNLPNMEPDQIKVVMDDLRARIGNRKAGARGPLEAEPQPSDLPFTDKRGTDKRDSDQPLIVDAPVLSPQEREFRRQDAKEKETMELLTKERSDRERRALGKIQKYRDEVAQQLARERELEAKDKRRVAPAQLVDLRQRMDTIAAENMYVDAADMARSLLEKKPRGKALTAQENDFLRLWQERKRLTRGVSGAEDARLTKFGREQAQKEGELVETEQKLIEASRSLNEKAQTASSPEETEELAGQADEAKRHAEQIRTEVGQARAAREAARQEQQEYPLGAPVNRVAGNSTQVRLPDGRKLQARYAVVQAKDLIVSHHPESFEWNDRYQPQKMQPRDYKKNKEAQAGVVAGGNEFDVDSFHNTDNTGHNGPSIVLSDGRVAGGNGRAMRLIRAYKSDQAEAIHADLVQKAQQFGIRPEDIPPAGEMPVLVRVLDDSPVDLQTLIELGQDLNRDEARGFSAAEQAVMSADRLSQSTLEWVGRRLDDMGEDANIRELMRHQGLELFQKMVADGVISPTKRAEFVTGKGELTERAKDIFENAMLGKVINDADLIATMPKQIRDKLFRSLAPLSKIRAAEPAWDFTDYLQEAARHWKRIESLTDTLDVYGKDLSRSEQYMRFQNGKMIKEGIHPAVEALIRLLDEKPLKIKESFYRYIDDYEGRQQTLMGVEPPNPRFAFNKDIAEKVGVEVHPGEWGTTKPVERVPEQPKIEAIPEPSAEDDFSELSEVPTGELEADLEQLREITEDENDPMVQGYIRELAKRTDRGQKPTVGAAPTVAIAEPPAERKAVDAAEETARSLTQDASLAAELSTSGPLTEEKLLDIIGRHPKYSAGKASASVAVIKSFVQNYLKEDFDKWLERSIAQVKVGGRGPTDEDALFQGKKMDPLPGFEHTFEERKVARAEAEGKKLSRQILEKKGDISKKSGDMERHSPLFAGSGASGERSLFDPTPEPTHDPTRMLDATPEDEPPLAEGMVRVYRGESVPGTGRGVPDWVKDSEEFKRIEEASGRWFSLDRSEAQKFADEAGTGRVVYVDVPRDQLDKWRASNNPEASKFVHHTKRESLNDEFFLPREIARDAVNPRGKPRYTDTEAAKLMTGNQAKEHDWFGQAKDQLGPGASVSEVLLLAQKLKQEAISKPAPGMLFQDDPQVKSLLSMRDHVRQKLETATAGEEQNYYRARLGDINESLRQLGHNWQMYQANKGAVEFIADGRAVIHLLENADISTVLHEFAHVARRQLKPEDMQVVQDWLHIKDGVWHVIHEEKFARAFEKYLYDGEAPTPGLKPLFRRIREWMIDVYKQVKGTAINIKVPDEVRQVFDRMVAGEDIKAERAQAKFTTSKGSTYAVDGEKTTRNKSYHPEHGTEDQGPQPKSDTTFYVSPENAKVLGEIQSKGGPRRTIARASDGRVGLKYLEGKDAGKFEQRTMVPAEKRPSVGLIPVEVWSDRSPHFGNEIVSVDESPRKPRKVSSVSSVAGAIEQQARRTQDAQETRGQMVTPTERMEAVKIAEGGEALAENMSDARMRVFPDQEQAIQWAKENKDRLRGVQLFTLADGRGFAHYLPRNPNILFQEIDPVEIDRRIRMIDERMGKIIPEAERAKLGKMRQELAAQKARAQRVLDPTPGTFSHGKVLKLWTPEGEREISDAPRKPDSERGIPSPPPELQESRRVERLPEQTGRPGSVEQDRPTGRARGTSRSGATKRDGGQPRKALSDVAPAKLDAPVRDRGTELYTKEQWAERVKLLRLPSNAPAPTVRLPLSMRRMLIFPGQSEVAEMALSGLKQTDAFIMGTTTGTGKTYTGSAVLNQIHKPGMKTLILTTSQDLIHQRGIGWIAVARDFDVDVQELPPGVSMPDEPGTYTTTYATAIGRPDFADGKWDFIIADEIGEARKWYSSQRGAMMKTLATNAGKVLWMSATPFHTALEIGHMDKLGLWREQGWPAWSAQFGVYRDTDGNWAGGNAPKKLLKLREQLIERGQYVNVDRNMEGFETSFAQVPLTDRQVADVRNISKAFALAEEHFTRKKRKSMIRAVKGNAVTYVKKYLERARLPQAIEMGRKLEEQGWKVVFFSETKTERDEIFDFLKEADEEMGGQISELLPPLPSVPEELEKIFLNDIANYSGPHSAFRTSEKDAFNNDSKKHIYVSYAAGGIGVSLHDTSGVHPRAVIYLGPPYSGVMFDQAIGRAWRYGTRSNVHAIFMTSNARPEVQLILQKVAPRMSSLRALVSGIDEQDKFVNTLRSMDSTREGQISYELGNKVKVDADDFMETETTHAVQSWKDVKIQSANTAKNKGMKFPVEPEGAPSVIKLFQRGEEEYESPEPPDDLQMPGESRATEENQRRRDEWEDGIGVDLPAPNRTVLADDISSQAGEDARQGDGDPLAAIRLRWDNTKKYVTTVWDNVEGSRPVKAAKVQDMYWLTNGRKVIRDVAADAGSPATGIRISRMLPEYHVQWGNIAGPWVNRYMEILKENKISTKRKVQYRDAKTGEMKEVNEHHNLVMAKQGKQPPANERIARAVEQTTELMNQVRARLAKENVAVEVYDQSDGRKRLVPFDQIMDDPNYWPRKYDPEYEIRTTNEDTGQVETVKLKELLGGEIGEKKRERIIKYMMREHGMKRVDAEDFLEGRGRDVPLVGNVERARQYDLPFYRTDPGAMISYLEGAAEAAARTKTFGQKREILEREIGKIGDVKARARIREIMDSVLSKRPFEDETRAFVSLVADWSVLTKMGFSALKAVGHSVHAAMSSNTRAYLKGLMDGVTNWKEAHSRAVMSGAIVEQYKVEMLREYGAKQKISSKFLDIVGFQSMYEFGRVVSDATARQFLDKYALPKLKAEKGADYYRRTLKDVYLLDDAAIDQAIQDGKWTEEDMHRAGKALSDKTMFTYDPSELPPAWRARSKEPIADNVLAGVRIATLLKGYMFKTSALLRERLFDEVKQGNFRPLIPFLVLYPIMGEIIADLSALFTANRKRYDDLFNDKESFESKLMYRFIGDMAHATGLTIIDTLLESAFRQHSAVYAARDVYEFFAGPFLADALHTFVQLPAELASAQTKKRGTSAGEKRYNALIRWLRSTFPVTSPLVNLTKEDKKKGSHGEGSKDYRFTPMPTQ